jgi:glutamine amidotransferase
VTGAPRVGVCDYGVGNLRSVERALERGGARALITADPRLLADCDGLVLPGVGAFVAAAQTLRSRGLDVVVREMAAAGRPVLGVCLGFQLLFTESDEGTGGQGIGLIPGRVRRLAPSRGKVPHMGWNRLDITRASLALDGVQTGEHMYFVHSYAVTPDDLLTVVAVTDHGGPVVAAVEVGNVCGTQFHPEKSGSAGLRVYANFAARCTAPVRA